MQLFLQISAGSLLLRLAGAIYYFASWAVNLGFVVFAALLLIRWLMDALQVSPFGRIVYYLRRPTDGLVSHMRGSRFYFPLRQALKFNPAILMALIAMVILWYIALTPIGNLVAILSGLALSLMEFSSGRFFTGLQALIGALLMSLLCFLMALMTLIFINWLSGWFEYASFWALQRINPMLRYIESKGNYAEWSFLILWLALYIASILVQVAFFRNIQIPGRQI
ncbi:MAG TPA: hypothetical protein PLD20_06815 [Blastocatellia bacterium]|nr:hypothetical protein [Blastocatellia bacterium]HMX26084.1 hypothetical protein [Blastocatellia bacterium]HMZ17620.1 hypothetical protein [Blastocatellia bacterium]HNG29781.1 hypothetical protein [Blastocatellia bacterium]